MRYIKVVGGDFSVDVSVDADRNDERGEWSIDEDQEGAELVGMLITLGSDERGVSMTEENATIAGIAMAMQSHGYTVEFEEQEIRPDLDGI